MRKTLFRQFLLYMIIFGIAISGVSIVIIEFFFDDYYYLQQEKLLVSHTDVLAVEYNESGIAALQTLIDEYYLDLGMSVHFLDIENGMIYGTESPGFGNQGLTHTITKSPVGEVFISTTGTQSNSKEWLSYIIKTNDENIIFARISYTSMDSVVGLVQQFFLIFGVVLAVIFIIFAYLFSKSMSHPLKELNSIAKKMGQLDFSLKYDGKRKDEIGMLGNTLNDITSKLENTISQLQGELSKERTLEKMRTQFTAQVSHELQTPLSVIKGYSEALADQIYSSEEASGIYDILLAEAEKISHMVDDLLDLSQMESGAYVIRKSDFSLVHLITRIFNKHKNLPAYKNFQMQLTIDYPEEILYSGDTIRLEQAIRNILTNAIKHVSENGLIQVSLFLEDNKSILSVTNSGDPIPDDDITHIFDSYYQGRNNRGGTGLGLAISNHIVKLHGGSISTANTADGVLFTISLPNF